MTVYRATVPGFRSLMLCMAAHNAALGYRTSRPDSLISSVAAITAKVRFHLTLSGVFPGSFLNVTMFWPDWSQSVKLVKYVFPSFDPSDSNLSRTAWALSCFVPVISLVMFITLVYERQSDHVAKPRDDRAE